MSSIQAAQVDRVLDESRDIPSALLLLLATGAGLGAASLYYCQPLLMEISDGLRVRPSLMGLVPTLTQLGYASGVLLLAPLGDRYDRRIIILVKTALLSLALLSIGLASGFGMLLGASLLVGASATMAQDVVPAAAVLAPESQRGKIVGKVMTGLLLGILLSRVASGFIGQHWGWRTVYLLASLAVMCIGLLFGRGLPRFAKTTELSYRALIASMLGLWRRHAPLRHAAMSQGLLAVSFGAFWSTLAMMLHARYGLGSAVAGALGLAGAAGALAAPLGGKLADRRGAKWVTQQGSALTALSFGAMAIDGWLPDSLRLGFLVLMTILFDFGMQATLVGHQTVVYGLDAGARSRLNAVLLTCMFIGMASGAAFGSLALARWGWLGVVGLCSLVSFGAWLVRCYASRVD